MEALCVSLSLFSTQIKKIHRWLWVVYTPSSSNHSLVMYAFSIHPEKQDLSPSGSSFLLCKMGQNIFPLNPSESHWGRTDIWNTLAHSYWNIESSPAVTVMFIVYSCCIVSADVSYISAEQLSVTEELHGMERYLFHRRSSLVLQLLSMWPDHMWLTWKQLHCLFLLTQL